MLRGFGLKVGPVGAAGFERRIRELVTGQATLERVMEPMLRARQALRSEYWNLHRDLLQRIVRTDDICRRLMTVAGVGAVVPITFTSAVDDPARFRRSKDVGAHFGLTPRKYQSGETDRTGRISKVGDAKARISLLSHAVRGGERDAHPRHALLGPEGLGRARGEPAWNDEGEGGIGTEACRRPAPYVGGRHRIPLGPRAGRRSGVALEEDEIGAGPEARFPDVPSRGRLIR